MTIIENYIFFEEALKEILPSLITKTIKTYDFANQQYINLAKYLFRLPLQTLHPSNIILLKVGP